jgi:hypothetical protein
MKRFLLVCSLVMICAALKAQPNIESAKNISAVNTMVDAWHQAAAVADEKVFFGSMTIDAVYLGTDANERWVRPEFEKWSEKYFQKDVAWNFKPYNRFVQFSDEGKTAWWDEKLETWMGICAGAGVASLTNEGWKIRHYQLAMMIPNDDIKSVLETLKKAAVKPEEHKE